MFVLLLLTGCGLRAPWSGSDPDNPPKNPPAPPPADCRQIPGPEACDPDERCIFDGVWRCVPGPGQ